MSAVPWTERLTVFLGAGAPGCAGRGAAGQANWHTLQHKVRRRQGPASRSAWPGAQHTPPPWRRLLRELAASNPPAFLCHYYNHYFAHTGEGPGLLPHHDAAQMLGRAREGSGRGMEDCLPGLLHSAAAVHHTSAVRISNGCACLAARRPAAGGRMIGKSVSNAVLDGWTGAFYTWEGDVKVGRVARSAGCATCGLRAVSVSDRCGVVGLRGLHLSRREAAATGALLQQRDGNRGSSVAEPGAPCHPNPQRARPARLPPWALLTAACPAQMGP